MSETAARLLATLDTLEPHEQRELLTELLRRSGALSETSSAGDHLVGFADDLFQSLDAEETDGRESHAR